VPTIASGSFLSFSGSAGANDSQCFLTTGRTRFDRLFLIGRCSVALCVDALKAAVVEAKKGQDVQRYRDAWECLRTAAPGEPEATFDDAWAQATDKANKAETQRLEAQLKGYKNNLVKESIRVRVPLFTKFNLWNITPDLNCRWETKTSASTTKKLVISKWLEKPTAVCDQMLAPRSTSSTSPST
jgi:hypothetical protein